MREAEHFDKLADTTGEIWWGSVTPAGVERLKKRARYVEEALKKFSDPYVLELGCGTGAFTKPLLEIMPKLRLVGIDVSSKTIEHIEKRMAEYPNVKFEVADSTQLLYGDATFDAVVGNSVLHHVPIDTTISEMHRVLKPGGIIWFSEPNMMNPQIALEKNIRFIGEWLQNSPDETAFFRWRLARHLREVGFEKVAVLPFDFLHPGMPVRLIDSLNKIGQILERTPIIKEIAGSLRVFASKPEQS